MALAPCLHIRSLAHKYCSVKNSLGKKISIATPCYVSNYFNHETNDRRFRYTCYKTEETIKEQETKRIESKAW